MKKLLILFVACFMAAGVMAQYAYTKATADVKSDLKDYKYAYIIPTSGVTSSSGAAMVGVFGHGVYGNTVSTTNPAEIISGFLIKKGFSILPQPVPELAEQTLIVSYGYTGTQRVAPSSYVYSIVIQLSDGASHESLATYEAFSPYASNESRSVAAAINAALPLIGYSINPKLYVAQKNVSKNNIKLYIANYTPNTVRRVDIKATYIADNQIIHEQIASLKVFLQPGDEVEKSFKRDKQVQSRDIHVKMVVDYYE